MNNDHELIEKLSDYEHDRWSRWQKHLFSICAANEDGSLTIPKEYVDKWTEQINTAYIDLTEKEKDADRREAKMMLECIREK